MPRNSEIKRVLVTGGAGYVGAVLVPKMLEAGYQIRVLDLFLYGDDVLDSVAGHANLEILKGDIRDQQLLRKACADCDAVIHLACISNDPSFELNPELGKSINLDAFRPLVEISREAGVRRFIYASSSSVYGVSDAPEVTEDHPLNPLTDYSRFKGECEDILMEYLDDEFVPVILRPATVCGYSPRQRLDVIVNILTNHAWHRGKIRVDGGGQKRPNIHIKDMAAAYLLMLDLPNEKISGRIYNVGNINHTVSDLAKIVKREVELVAENKVEIEVVPVLDQRSYHISSSKLREEFGFIAETSISAAVRDLIAAFAENKLPNAFEDSKYYNVKLMQERKIVLK